MDRFEIGHDNERKVTRIEVEIGDHGQLVPTSITHRTPRTMRLIEIVNFAEQMAGVTGDDGSSDVRFSRWHSNGWMSDGSIVRIGATMMVRSADGNSSATKVKVGIHYEDTLQLRHYVAMRDSTTVPYHAAGDRS